ncbi:MAG TPA: YHS domain-containing protein [Thermomicrobiales bacterium]|nr:YHS domain-containing protein [Thermomicrobiales bacterium]
MVLVTDPVCGRIVDTTRAESSAEHIAQLYHFCSEECRRIFEDNPEECLSSPPPGTDGEGLAASKGRIDHGPGRSET